jgi:hypothetical protein
LTYEGARHETVGSIGGGGGLDVADGGVSVFVWRLGTQPHSFGGDALRFLSSILIGVALLVLFGGITHAAPIVYTNEAQYLADLAELGYSTIHESFEDSIVWADSRNSISSPGRTPTVTSQGIVWASNYPQNSIATGTVGGSAPDGAFAIYSLPHGMTTDSGLYCDSAEDPDIPIECYQNDGLKVAAEAGDTLYAFGGRIDTANSGKVTFLLDSVDINGNDTDNIDNWQREGEWAANSAFVGVLDTDGFLSAELRELRGKDFQQVLLFSDDFTIGTLPEALLGDVNLDTEVNGLDVDPFVDVLLNGPYQPEADMNDDQVVNGLDVDPFVTAVVGGTQPIPEPSTLLLCIIALGVVSGWRKWKTHGRLSDSGR